MAGSRHGGSSPRARDKLEHHPARFFATPATLGWLAADTTRIELGTTVMRQPLRHVLDSARIVGRGPARRRHAAGQRTARYRLAGFGGASHRFGHSQ
jgi:hypothetical protein